MVGSPQPPPSWSGPWRSRPILVIEPHGHLWQHGRSSRPQTSRWTFLSDAGRKVQKDLDIQEYTDPYHDPMIPHTLVLKPGQVIHSIYNGYWFWGRPSFEDLRRDLREATRDIRPDWDLTMPELRTAWEAGDRSKFYPDPDVRPVSPRLHRNTVLGQGPPRRRPTAPKASL